MELQRDGGRPAQKPDAHTRPRAPGSAPSACHPHTTVRGGCGGPLVQTRGSKRGESLRGNTRAGQGGAWHWGAASPQTCVHARKGEGDPPCLHWDAWALRAPGCEQASAWRPVTATRPAAPAGPHPHADVHNAEALLLGGAHRGGRGTLGPRSCLPPTRRSGVRGRPDTTVSTARKPARGAGRAAGLQGRPEAPLSGSRTFPVVNWSRG